MFAACPLLSRIVVFVFALRSGDKNVIVLRSKQVNWDQNGAKRNPGKSLKNGTE
jgi:hypothetical protein